VTLGSVAVIDLWGYVMLPIESASGSDGLKLRHVQRYSEEMIAADSGVDVGLAEQLVDMETTAGKCYLVTTGWKKGAELTPGLLKVAEMLIALAAVKPQHYLLRSL
jgi:hypothetical protein